MKKPKVDMKTGRKKGIGLAAFGLMVVAASPIFAQNLDYDPDRYNNQMMRLSTILGNLHHLRGVCVSGEQQLWRDNMMELIRLEDPPELRKTEMVASFNAAYEEARVQFPACNNTTRQKAYVLAGEGASISDTLATSFSQDEE